MSTDHSSDTRPRKVSSKAAKQSSVFTKPSWCASPKRRGVHLEVWRPKKDGSLERSRPVTEYCYHASNIRIDSHSYYLFGSKADVCDFAIHHPTCSRVHMAIVHHAETGAVYVVDLNSTHGTFINGARVPPSSPIELKPGEVLQTGFSSRSYILRMHAPIRKEIKMEVASFLDEIRADEKESASQVEDTQKEPENAQTEKDDSEKAEEKPRVGYHILIKHAAVRKPSFKGKTITRTKEDAIQLLNNEIQPKLGANLAEFAECAKIHSECASGVKSGGKMPPMPRDKDWGELNPLRDALWSLRENELSSPIETVLGVHLVMWQSA